MKIKHLALLSILVLFIAVISEYLKVSGKIERLNTSAIQKMVLHKEAKLDEYNKKLYNRLIDENIAEVRRYNELFDEEGLAYYVFENDSLVYWSNSSIPINNYDILKQNGKIIRLQNGYYYIKNIQYDTYFISGLLLIKYEFVYENKFLRNEFHADFNFPAETKISLNEEIGVPVNAANGNYLFSILECKDDCTNTGFVFPFIVYLLFIIILFLTGNEMLYAYKKIYWVLIPVYTIFFFALKYLMLQFQFPVSFYNSELFKSSLYAYSDLIPSLGDLLLTVLFVLYISFIIKKHLEIKDAGFSNFRNWKIYGLTIVGLLLFFAVEKVINNLVLNSGISFELYNVLDLSIYSVIAYFIVFILFVSFIFIYQKILNFVAIQNFQFFVLYCCLTALLFALIYSIFPAEFSIWSLASFYFLNLFIIFKHIHKKYDYSSILVLVFFIAIYIAFHISEVSEHRENEIRKVFAINLANEHDPVAEILLKDLEKELQSDEEIRNLMFSPDFDFNVVYDYIKKNHLSGFWGKYEIMLTICSPADSLIIEPENTIHYCYGFFDDMLARQGINIENSSFYYLDNQNGRITYFGTIEYRDLNNYEIKLFIQLDSKFIGAQLGYPELLLDDDLFKADKMSNYSYAKYRDDQLISQFGDYPFSLNRKVYENYDREFSTTTRNNFHHLIYNIDEQTTIIISKPRITFYDYLIMFSYLFVFYFFLVTMALIILNKQFNVLQIKLNLKNRIQLLIISILFASLFIIGSITVYYIVNQYKGNHYQNISERIQSVLVEMDHKLGNENSLESIPKDYLTTLLIKFSNVFYTDINVYDLKGELYATSRDEIFDRGLTGQLINPVAYYELSEQNRAEFIHDEKIGKLQFISAYVPFISNDNVLLAYLNLPYFTKQNILQKEVSSFVVTMINIYVLLILVSLILAVLLSNRLTKPLRMLQEKFREMAINESYEQINYVSDDELGVLVSEYNKMVVELNKSIKLLARSEREMAWREMAKQIAHEIKNPLTPMKLSLQLLQKSWENKDADFNDRLKKVSDTMIEQIDSLSAIATEFSAFAQMPRETFEKIEIIAKIENSLNLFQESDRLKLIFHKPDKKNIYVFGDKEQLLRVFNNLIKNAIQAIPKEINGVVNIDLELDEKYVIVKIMDNGTGVKSELRQKLFEPNFTTKSSGMGLGLALVKRIIENMQGEIWFETIEGNGSVFYVKLPLYAKE